MSHVPEQKEKSIIIERSGTTGAPTGRFRRARRRLPLISLAFLLMLAKATSALKHGYRDRLALADPPPNSTQPNKDTMVREVVTLDQEIKDTNARIAMLQSKSAELETGIEATKAEIESGKERLSRKRQALALRIRNMYVNGKSTNLDMLLSSSDLSDFLTRSEYVNKVTDKDVELIDSVKLESQKLEQSLAQLKAQKDEIDSTSSDLQSRQQRLVQSRSARQELLSKAGDSQQAVAQKSAQVSAKINELNPSNAPSVVHSGRFMTM
jgi:peptidoglycan hydrolase CwlO-like protein